MTNDALSVGTYLHHGIYLIQKVIGRGGFGITYLALDTNLDKMVAIKEFFPSQFCSREFDTNHLMVMSQSQAEFVYGLKHKFLKEAKNIARLNHPNIIKIYAAFEENETAYYVMEYIEGNSLAQEVSFNGRLPLERATGYIMQIGGALEYLHSNHMTHLDVKPGNIMIRTADDCPILIDFGLSKNYDVEGMATTTTTLGVSPGYSPIEQYNMTGSKVFSPRSDLYSLAATFYFMLMGSTPPEAINLITSPLYLPPQMPARIAKAISTAMRANAELRHETVRDFLNQISGNGSWDIGSQRRSDYSKNSTPGTKQKGKRNFTTIASICVGIMLVIALVGGLIVFLNGRGNEDVIGDSSDSAVIIDDIVVEEDPQEVKAEPQKQTSNKNNTTSNKETKKSVSDNSKKASSGNKEKIPGMPSKGQNSGPTYPNGSKNQTTTSASDNVGKTNNVKKSEPKPNPEPEPKSNAGPSPNKGTKGTSGGIMGKD